MSLIDVAGLVRPSLPSPNDALISRAWHVEKHTKYAADQDRQAAKSVADYVCWLASTANDGAELTAAIADVLHSFAQRTLDVELLALQKEAKARMVADRAKLRAQLLKMADTFEP